MDSGNLSAIPNDSPDFQSDLGQVSGRKSLRFGQWGEWETELLCPKFELNQHTEWSNAFKVAFSAGKHVPLEKLWVVLLRVPLAKWGWWSFISLTPYPLLYLACGLFRTTWSSGLDSDKVRQTSKDDRSISSKWHFMENLVQIRKLG